MGEPRHYLLHSSKYYVFKKRGWIIPALFLSSFTTTASEWKRENVSENDNVACFLDKRHLFVVRSSHRSEPRWKTQLVTRGWFPLQLSSSSLCSPRRLASAVWHLSVCRFHVLHYLKKVVGGRKAHSSTSALKQAQAHTHLENRHARFTPRRRRQNVRAGWGGQLLVLLSAWRLLWSTAAADDCRA